MGFSSGITLAELTANVPTAAQNAAATVVAMPATAATSLFGVGADGAVTLVANATLTRDMSYTTLTVNGGVTLTVAGFRIRASVSVMNDGTISNPGSAAGAVTPGNGALSGSLNGGGNGGTGGFGGTLPAPGVSVTPSIGADGGAGGGAAGGRASGGPLLPAGPLAQIAAIPGLYGGAGGGGGSISVSGGGNQSGGGGGGGGLLVIASPTVVNNGAISANGGSGGSAVGPASNSGGGGGGGGAVYLLTDKAGLSGGGTITASGGAKGLGVNGGLDGVAGIVGTVLIGETV